MHADLHGSDPWSIDPWRSWPVWKFDGRTAGSAVPHGSPSYQLLATSYRFSYNRAMAEPGQLDLTFQLPQRQVWTVRELMGALRTSLEREYGDVWVEGEVSNYRPAESGHLYFTLKDGEAQLKAVMFRSQARLLKFRPEHGMQVLARGRVTLYEARGDLQLSVEYLEPKGAGALQVAFEQLKPDAAADQFMAEIKDLMAK